MDDVSSCKTAPIRSVHAVEQHLRYSHLYQLFERILLEHIESTGRSNSDVRGIENDVSIHSLTCLSNFLLVVTKYMEMESAVLARLTETEHKPTTGVGR